MTTAEAAPCVRRVTAQVVAIDQPIMFNRLGAQNVNGMMFALRRDVVDAAGRPLTSTGAVATPGQVTLRRDKRPRPLVLRVAEGDCLVVQFQNLLNPNANPLNARTPNLTIDDQVADRSASFHVMGMQVANEGTAPINNDGSHVGQNQSGAIVGPGATATYVLYAEKQGTYAAQSYGATFGSDGLQGNQANGLFGAVNVEPRGARFYRTQVPEEELRLAADRNRDGIINDFSATPPAGFVNERTPAGQPIINYEAVYPTTGVWAAEGKAGLPVLNMLRSIGANTFELVHSDLDAVIAGPNADGSFPRTTYPLENVGRRNPVLPNRLEAFREFTIVFHDEVPAAQAFPAWFSDTNNQFSYVLQGVRDAFMINYGSGGVGSEIIANRLGVGPMHDCLTCSYEEFFLTSYAVGDPAMVVDTPANFGLEQCNPALQNCAAVGPKATFAFYPDDPANVNHAYVGDRVVMRNVHVGKEQHVFHLHNHQWLYNPNDDNSNYIDAQGLGPGSGYTYELVNGGAGNRNRSAGDAIYHCHFYPHFAQGMWSLFRIHDVYETGTVLEATTNGGLWHTETWGLDKGKPSIVPAGTPAQIPGAPAGATGRALPDGEIVAGTPIPAVIPLPGKGMPPMPGRVQVVPKRGDPVSPATEGVIVGSKALVDREQTYTAADRVATQLVGTIKNPGYPFWVAGIEDVVGQRPTTPPLDMDPAAGGFDGGLPRHAMGGISQGGVAVSTVNKRDFSKVVEKGKGIFFPEAGTPVERAVMDFHGRVRNHPSFAMRMNGTTVAANFVTNGYRDTTIGNPAAAPQAGSPYHEPCVDDRGRRLVAGVTGAFFDGTLVLPGAQQSLTVTGSSVFNATAPRLYKGVNIQYDAVLNKAGYHYPQQRILALWEDAVPTILKQRPAEPLVMRMNTFDCGMYRHANLVPEYFEMDDYQVRTPTDIIGQHIHLPKWDLTTTDGAANGWNYEDGTLAPGSVRERIHAINHGSKTAGTGVGSFIAPTGPLAPAIHPFFAAKAPAGANWSGSRVTLQRWFADPIVNADGRDRGLGTIFTHDHYGPSTHQQVGLYATVLTEPAGSRWSHNETGQQLGCRAPAEQTAAEANPASAPCRADGGPVSWQAIIEPAGNQIDPYREFYLEFSDFQHAYEAGVYVGADENGVQLPRAACPDAAGIMCSGVKTAAGTPSVTLANTFRYGIQVPVRQQVNPVFPDLYVEAASVPGSCPTRPCPQAISVQDPGMHVVNYRSEPVGLRVYDPAALGPDGRTGRQAGGERGDLAFALQSRTDRVISALNQSETQLGFHKIGTTPVGLNASGAIGGGDPFTPMLRAYSGDTVRVRIQAGGHEEEHNTTINGVKWLQAGSSFGRAGNSGWRNNQAAGISEQFMLFTPVLPVVGQQPGGRDYSYAIDSSMDGWWSGTWGLFRAYEQLRPDLAVLPNNRTPMGQRIRNAEQFSGVCPTSALPARQHNVVAVLANAVLPKPGTVTIAPTQAGSTMHVGGPLDPLGGTLVYNPRPGPLSVGPLHDPTAMLYVRLEDLNIITGAGCAAPGSVTNPACGLQLKPNVKVEPLVLRAAAGECIDVTLYNRLPAVAPDLASYGSIHGVVKRDRFRAEGSTTFNNNLIRPSSYVGLMPQLVSVDVTRNGGANIGQNEVQTVPPMTASAVSSRTYRWYAGDLRAPITTQDRVTLIATPIEFGGSGLLPADNIKQGQKSLVGGLVILPQNLRTWTEDNGNRTAGSGHTAASYVHPRTGRPVRDFMSLITKFGQMRYSNGDSVEHLNGEGTGIPEDSQDNSHMVWNYGTEPMWFRFGLQPNAPFGNTPGGFGSVLNANLAYTNALAGGDPATPVFAARRGEEVRFHVALPHSTGRGSTFHLHGHWWQRDPYICPGETRFGGNNLAGSCGPNSVGSLALGTNPYGFAQGSQESLAPSSHYTFLLPSAGGVDGVIGDYLFRDQGGLGNAAGLWGILRILP